MGVTGSYVTLCVKIPRDLREKMDVLARELGVSWSEIVRVLLGEKVAELERLAKLSKISSYLSTSPLVTRGFSESVTVMIRDSLRRFSPTQVRS